MGLDSLEVNSRYEVIPPLCLLTIQEFLNGYTLLACWKIIVTEDIWGCKCSKCCCIRTESTKWEVSR